MADPLPAPPSQRPAREKGVTKGDRGGSAKSSRGLPPAEAPILAYATDTVRFDSSEGSVFSNKQGAFLLDELEADDYLLGVPQTRGKQARQF